MWAFGITVYEMLHNALPWTSVAGLISTGTSNVDNKHIKVTAEDVALFSQFKVRALCALRDIGCNRCFRWGAPVSCRRLPSRPLI